MFQSANSQQVEHNEFIGKGYNKGGTNYKLE